MPWLSKCCDSPVYGEDIDNCICSKCKEHCDCYNDKEDHSGMIPDTDNK